MWRLETLADGNLSCENYELDSNQIDEVEKIVTNAFGNKIKEENIIISWDCWSGIYIMLNAGFNNYESSNVLIKKVYEYLINECKQ